MNYFIGSDGIILIDRFILTSFGHLIVSKMANWDVREWVVLTILEMNEKGEAQLV